jgi:signal transduction histidine kinase
VPVTGSQPDRAVMSRPSAAAGRALRWPAWAGWVGVALLYSRVMLWHSHRRIAASAEYVKVSEENERLLATQRRFLQDASHQLRTPITIALGHSELLARSVANSQDARDINVIVGELNRLRALSDRLLLIATAENPDFLQTEPLALADFAVEIIRRWRPTADRRWQLGPLAAVTVPADRERLSPAIDALLENAVTSPAQGPGLGRTGLASTGLASTGLASTGLASTGLASTGAAIMEGG